MHLVLYIGLGAGLSTAAGVRPFLPTLLAGLLGASGALGVSFSHSRYHFLQAGWWLVAVAVVFAAAWLLQLRIGSERFDAATPGASLAGLGVAAGALMFAGTLAHHGDLSWPGLLAGAVCALLAQTAVRPVVTGARRRLPDSSAREALTIYLDVAALLIAGLACVLHPLGYVVLALLAWLLVGRRRRSTEKYAGLRILGR